MGGFGEELPDVRYVFRCSYTHPCILLCTEQRCQRKSLQHRLITQKLNLHAAWRAIERIGASNAEMPTAPHGGRRNDGVGAPTANARGSDRSSAARRNRTPPSAPVIQMVV